MRTGKMEIVFAFIGAALLGLIGYMWLRDPELRLLPPWLLGSVVAAVWGMGILAALKGIEMMFGRSSPRRR
jgi:LPXTG-motif cell wall-anchored protein